MTSVAYLEQHPRHSSLTPNVVNSDLILFRRPVSVVSVSPSSLRHIYSRVILTSARKQSIKGKGGKSIILQSVMYLLTFVPPPGPRRESTTQTGSRRGANIEQALRANGNELDEDDGEGDGSNSDEEEEDDDEDDDDEEVGVDDSGDLQGLSPQELRRALLSEVSPVSCSTSMFISPLLTCFDA